MTFHATRVKEAVTSANNTHIVLGGAVDNFQTFVNSGAGGKTVDYLLINVDIWEEGRGIVTDSSPDTLTRDVIYDSSSGGSKITVSGSDFQVFNHISANTANTIDTIANTIPVHTDLIANNTTRIETLESASPIPTLDCLDVYDATGGQTISATPITINLDTERKKVGTSLSLASDEITANTTGIYLVDVRVSARLGSGTTRSSYAIWLEEDPLSVGAFAEISGTRAYGYCRVVGDLDAGAHLTMIWDASATDKLRIRAQEEAIPNMLTLADASSITLVRIG